MTKLSKTFQSAGAALGLSEGNRAILTVDHRRQSSTLSCRSLLIQLQLGLLHLKLHRVEKGEAISRETSSGHGPIRRRSSFQQILVTRQLVLGDRVAVDVRHPHIGSVKDDAQPGHL